MSYFKEVLDLLNSNQITREEADELFADVEINDALKYADTEIAAKDTQLMDDAHEYLAQRYKIMQKAGLPASVAPFLDGMTDLPGSNGTVPTEFRWNTGNGILRLATEYGEVNPLTGQRDINPFLDPTDENKALTLFEGTQEQARKLGTLGRDAGGKATGGPQKATEYVQRNIYRRSGEPIVMNNRGKVTDTDMVLPREGQRPLKVDGQATRPRNLWKPGMQRGESWRPGSQLYTRMNFTDGQKLNRYDRIKTAEKKFAQLVDSNPGLSLSQLMDGAYGKGYLSGYGYGNVPPVKGKVMDISHQPKDRTFWTIYDTQFSNRNEDAFDTISKAPDGVMMEFNDKSRAQVEALRGEDLKNNVFFTPAEDEALRMQIDHTALDSNALRRSDAVLKEKPELKQFLNYEQPVDEFIIPSGQPTTKRFTSEKPVVVSQEKPVRLNTTRADSSPEALRSKPTPGRRGSRVTIVRPADEPQIKPGRMYGSPIGPNAPTDLSEDVTYEKRPRTKEEPGSRIAKREEAAAKRAEATDFVKRDAERRSSFQKPGRAERIRRSQGLPPRLIPEGERGFVRTPGRAPVRTPSRAPVRAPIRAPGITRFAGAAGGDILTELGAGSLISYATGESDNPAEALVSTAGGLITSDNTGAAQIRQVDDKTYIHDATDNSLRDVDKGLQGPKMGIAILNGKEIAVPYGSVAGEKSNIDMIKDGLKDTWTAVKETAARRREEMGGSLSGRGAGRASFSPDKESPKPEPIVKVTPVPTARTSRWAERRRNRRGGK